MKYSVPALVLACVLACACGYVCRREASFVEAEYAPFKGPGNCSVSGRAFARTDKGEFKYPVDTAAMLTPVTSYSSEWFEHCVIDRCPLEESDPRALVYVRTTVPEADGRFVFSKIPPGRYFITCMVRWEEQISPGATRGTLIYAHAQVEIKAGERKTGVVVTRPVDEN
jgi:hypothetical protein